MRQIRNGVFETNSSSVHSITVCNKELEENRIPIDEDGYIHAYFSEFGWDIDDYYDQESKLSYLLTMAAHLNNCYPYCFAPQEQEEIIEKFVQTDDFKRISSEIADYANCEGVILDLSEGYIDHQSIYNNSLDEFLEWNNTNIIDFVFGGVIIHTDNDNY